MQQIPLSNIPSTDLTVTLDGAYWRLSFFLSINFVCVNIERNGTKIVDGLRCFMGQPLMPYEDMYEPDFGNFIFDNEVDWENFGGSCNLFYLDKNEFKQYKALTTVGMEESAIKNMAARSALFNSEYKASLDDSITPINIPRVTITSEPQDQTIIETLSARFSVVASNASSYQWEFSAQEEGAPWKEISGATGTTYSVPVVNRTTMGYYRCVVRGGSGVDVSRSAMLALSNIRPPVFTGQPQSIKLLEGSNVQLAVEAMYADAFQWERSTDQINWTAITGAVNATYTIMIVDSSTAGYYRVRAYGASGTMVASKVAHVEYGSAPVFVTQPASAKLKGGQPLHLAATVTGVTRYAWEFSPNGNTNWSALSAFTGPTLDISRPTAGNVGYYRLTAFNQFGNTQSNKAFVEVIELPSFVVVPKNQSIAEDGSLTVTVQASGYDTVKWEISKNNGSTWAVIAGETDLILEIPSASATNDGLYRVTLNNFAGDSVAQFAISVILKPVFLTQPSNMKVAEGGTLTTSANVQHATRFEWETSQDGQNWTTIIGQNSNTLRIDGALVRDSKYYRLVAIGAAATVRSNAVTATVVAIPRFDSLPKNTKVNENEAVIFAFSQTGADSIVWEQSVNNGASWAPVAGATGTAYAIASAKAKDVGLYRVTLSNFAGSVSTQFSLAVVLYPVFSTQPQNTKLKLGESLTLTVDAANADRYAWEWSDNGTGWTSITNATSSTLTIISPPTSKSGQYRARAFHETLVTVSNIATVEIIAMPVITAPLQDVRIDQGDSAVLAINASGQDSVKWEKSANGIDWTLIPGVTGLVYNITNATAADMGRYRVTVSNYAGSVSSTASVDIVMEPVIQTQPVGGRVGEGGSFTFTVSALYAAGYQWEKSANSPTTGFVAIPGATGPSFGIASAKMDDGGYYRVVLTNGNFRVVSDAVVLQTVALPVFQTQLNSANINEGSPFTLSFTSLYEQDIKWEYSLDGASWNTLVGASGKSYTVASAAAKDIGVYRVTISNFAGSKMSQANVAVTLRPVITDQPDAARVAANGNVTFAISANHATSYVWFKSANGTSGWTAIPGATSPSYTIASVQPVDAAFYRCQVENGSFVVNSDSAKLDVVILPVINTAPPGGDFVQGQPLTLTITQTGAESIKWEVSKDNGNSWNLIAGATTESYTIPSLSASDDGLYRVTVTNIAGSDAEEFTIVTYALPVFSTQPVDTTVISGKDLTLTGVASPVTAYQWQYSSDGANFTDISGQTTSQLKIVKPPVTQSGKYRLKATNVIAVSYSNEATVSIAALPVVTSQPANATIREGGSQVVRVNGTGYDSVRWETKKLGASDWTVEAATGLSFSVEATAANNNMAYRAVLVNSVGETPSMTRYLSVVLIPVVRQNITSKVVLFNTQNWSMTCRFDNSFAYTTYQWYFLAGGATGGYQPIAGQTTETLRFTGGLGKDKTGRYYCNATNTISSVKAEGQTATAHIQVQSPPIFTTRLADKTLNVGDNLTLTVVSDDPGNGTNGDYKYSWQRSYDNGVTWNDIPTANRQSLPLGTQGTAGVTKYKVSVQNDLGPTYSNTSQCTITVV